MFLVIIMLPRKYFLYTPNKNIIRGYRPRMKLTDRKRKIHNKEKIKKRSSTIWIIME